MATATMNVSLTKQQAEMIQGEVKAGRYTSASEFVRELVRGWEQKRVAEDLAGLEEAHAGTYERDTNAPELTAILKAKKQARLNLRRQLQSKRDQA